MVAVPVGDAATISPAPLINPWLKPLPLVAEATATLPAVAFGRNVKSADAAFAAGADTTEINPAVRADAATSAMRCLIVFVDICFLSLVRVRIS
jgi:hypothetical protein